MNRGFIGALCLSVIFALLAGCGGSQPPIGAPGAIALPAARGTKTFDYTGAEQHFKVPRAVTQLTITANGASGPSGKVYYCRYEGGNGGAIQAMTYAMLKPFETEAKPLDRSTMLT